MSAIKHIEFWVSNLRKSLDFYEQLFLILGWSKYQDHGFENDGTKIYFREKDVKKEDTIGPRHICFIAKSKEVVNKINNFLIKQKVNVIRGPIITDYNDKSSYHIDFYDPDGYILEVSFSI